MKRNVPAVLLFVLLLCLFGTMDAAAAIYKYVDKDGLVTFADDIQAVPPEFRARAVIVSGEQREEDVRPQQPQSLPKEETILKTGEPTPVQLRLNEGVETRGKRSFSSGALISAIILVSAVFLFVILGIIDADHKKIIQIARVVIIWLVSVFLLYSHAGDVVYFFRSIGSNVEGARRESGEKGKKAAEAMKALNTVVEHVEKSSTEPLPAGAEKKD